MHDKLPTDVTQRKVSNYNYVGRWGDGEMGRWGDREISVLLIP
jgi:hypothetical protein